MESNELSIWRLKTQQTEIVLRMQERQLESLRRERAGEQVRYERARQSFHLTKERVKHMAAPVMINKWSIGDIPGQLKREKSAVLDARARLLEKDHGVKRQTLTVTQNRRKLEVLNQELGKLKREAANKAELCAELDAIDDRIKCSRRENERGEAAASQGAGFQGEVISAALLCEGQSPYPDTAGDSGARNCHSGVAQGDQNGETGHSGSTYQAGGEAPCRDDSSLDSRLRNFAALKEDRLAEALRLQYLNRKGHLFIVEVHNRNPLGVTAQITPQARIDRLSLAAAKEEIVHKLRANGLKLHSIVIGGR